MRSVLTALQAEQQKAQAKAEAESPGDEVTAVVGQSSYVELRRRLGSP